MPSSNMLLKSIRPSVPNKHVMYLSCLSGKKIIRNKIYDSNSIRKNNKNKRNKIYVLECRLESITMDSTNKRHD